MGEDSAQDVLERAHIEFAEALFRITKGGSVTDPDQHVQAVEEIFEVHDWNFQKKLKYAQHLVSTPTVARYLSELRDRPSKATQPAGDTSPSSNLTPMNIKELAQTCGKDEHIIALAVIRDEARADGDFRAAVQAEVKRGEVAGHYQRMKINPNDAPGADDLKHLSPEELHELIQRNADEANRIRAAFSIGTSTRN